VPARGDGDLELRSDAVGGGDEDRVLEARGLEIEESTEAAEARVAAATCRRFRERLQDLDQRRTGVYVDAGVAIAVLAVPVGEILAPYGVLTRSSL